MLSLSHQYGIGCLQNCTTSHINVIWACFGASGWNLILNLSFSHENSWSLSLAVTIFGSDLHERGCTDLRVLLHFNYFIIFLGKFTLQTGDRNLEQLVLSLAFVHLALQELLILLKCLRACLPVLDLALELIFILLRLDLVLIKLLDTLLEVRDNSVLQSSILIALVQVHDQLLQLFLLLFDVDGVTFKIVFFLFLQHVVQLDIESVDDFVQLIA